MRKADMPPAPRRGQSSSRQKLTQKLDRTPGMRLFHDGEQGLETVVHRTSSATRNFFGSLSGLRQLASKSSRSWLIRDASLPADMNGLDTESNASSFGSMSAFGSKFGSAVDLAGLIGLEDLAVSGTPREVGTHSSSSIFLRSQLESGSRRNSLEGYIPQQCDGDEQVYEQRDDDIGTEQFALEGLVANVGYTDEATIQCSNVTDSQSFKNQQQESAATKIQSAFRASRIRSSVRARKIAVVTIQRFFRGYCARKSYLEILPELQASARTIRTRNQYRKLFNTVVMLQKLWLTVKSRKLKEQGIAATRIQSFYRGWLARKMYNAKLHFIILLQACERRRQAQTRYQALRDIKSLEWLQRLQECSAVKVQAAYRGWAARKSYGREMEIVVRLQACFRRTQLLKSFSRLRNAVRLIQGAWRLYKFQLQRKKQYHCAVKIQSVFRGWIVRRKFRRDVTRVVLMQSWVRRTLLVKEYQELRTSTLTIQQAWRNYHTRQLQLRRVHECAAVCIQAHYRGHLARKACFAEVARTCQAVVTIQQAWRAHKTRQLELHNDAKAQTAIKIQSAYRGHLCRRNYRLDVSRVVWMQACIRRQQAEKRYWQLLKVVRSTHRAAESQKSLVQVQEGAALIIQAFFRGWSMRKKVRVKLERVVLLQACARRMLVRKNYQMLSKAACTIQKAWRDFKDQQRRLQGQLETLAAVKIQSCYKGWISRKLFKSTLRKVVYTQACIRRNLDRKHYEELRRVVILLQRRWRKYEHLQLEKFCAAVKIQSRWRCYKQQKFYQSLLQHQINCSTRIQRWWRGRKILQNLRLEKWSRERAVTRIQAHFRGNRVRVWLQRRQHAVLRIESAYWSYAQRRPSKKVLPIEQQCHVCEQSADALHGSNGNLDIFMLRSPLRVADGVDSFVHISSRETHDSDCGRVPSQCSVPAMEDWNNVAIDELDQCLDTCLAALPLSAASSRQLASAPSQQCSLTFDVVSSTSSMDHLDTTTASPGSVIAPQMERTASPASSKKSQVRLDWVGAGEVYGSTASEVAQSDSEVKSTPHTFYPSSSRQLLVGEGQKPHVRSRSKEEEKLQHFAQIFLTMRQISIQQQRAQSAPPFPPSLEPLSSQTPTQSPPIGAAAPVDKASSTRRSRNSGPLPSTPALSLEQGPQVSSQRADVVLNMEELLKTLEQYCGGEGDSGGCDMVTEGDVESGQTWRLRKTGLSMTSASTLGITHLKLPDVNAVLIVLVAMVVYTRTVCREVFFGTRQSHRKN